MLHMEVCVCGVRTCLVFCVSTLGQICITLCSNSRVITPVCCSLPPQHTYNSQMRTLCSKRYLISRLHCVLYVTVVGLLLGLVVYQGRLKVGKPVVQSKRQLTSNDVTSDEQEQDPTLSPLHLSKESVKIISDKTVNREKHYNKTWVPREVVDASLLPDGIVKGVNYFVFFVGHGRGGSSILGSLVDAHPHMVVATDYQLFHKWNEDPEYHRNRSVLYTALYMRAKKVAWGYKNFDSRGYSLFIPDAYMGKYQDHITVIGEKEAGSATASFSFNKERWLRTYEDIKRTTKVPVKLVQVHIVYIDACIFRLPW